MNKLVLDNKEFSELPYSGTTVAWTKTKGDIEGKIYELREKGILKKHAWLTEGRAGDEIETLVMELEIPVSDTQLRTIQLKFQPTMIYRVKKNRQRREVTEIMRDTSYRLFYWHFKTKMEAVQYGLDTMENEFMSNIMYALPDGREVTFGDVLKMLLVEDKIGAVLEDKREAKAVEAEVSC